jgi:hypothetical protein
MAVPVYLNDEPLAVPCEVVGGILLFRFRQWGALAGIGSGPLRSPLKGLAFALREDTKLPNVNDAQQRLGCMDLFHHHSLR